MERTYHMICKNDTPALALFLTRNTRLFRSGQNSSNALLPFALQGLRVL